MMSQIAGWDGVNVSEEIIGDVNNDSQVNVIDTALVTYWQGKEDTSGDWGWFSHLDINGDGRVCFLDVIEAINSI